MRHIELFTVALTIFGASSLSVLGQTAVPQLYTDAQAQNGAPLYQQQCAACHGDALQGIVGPALKGPMFHDMANQQGLTVESLLGVVYQSMPQDDPGSLPPDQYNAIVAYILQQNGYPSGSVELSPTAPRLKELSLGQ